MDKEYKTKLFNELGINSIHHKGALIHEGGKREDIVEFSFFKSNAVETLLNKCAAADIGNLANIDFANIVIAAQKVINSSIEDLSANIQELKKELQKFDRITFKETQSPQLPKEKEK